jgi:hypothetical protein
VVTSVREEADLTVVDVELTRSNRTDAERRDSGYTSGWRFWVPRRSSGWFGSQCLWIENTDTTAWELVNVTHAAAPRIGGDPEGDTVSPAAVPGLFLPLAAWVDEKVGLGIGVTMLGEGLALRYWRSGKTYHADCRQLIRMELEPGDRYDVPGPVAIHFGYRTDTVQSLLADTQKVRREAMALQPR